MDLSKLIVVIITLATLIAKVKDATLVDVQWDPNHPFKVKILIYYIDYMTTTILQMDEWPPIWTTTRSVQQTQLGPQGDEDVIDGQMT